MAPPRKRQATVGTFGSSSTSRSTPAGSSQPRQLSIQEVHLDWKAVLEDITSRYGGTTPAYETENISERKYVSHVTFRIACDTRSNHLKLVCCTSCEKVSPHEAESEAAAAGLQTLCWGPFASSVVDTSQMRILEMERCCKHLLLETRKFVRVCKADMENWCEAISRIKACHTSLHEKILKNFFRGDDWAGRQILSDAVDTLISIKNRYEAKLEELLAEMKECKAEGEGLYDAITDHMHPELVPKAHDREEVIESEVRVSSKVVLVQMLKSLGWGNEDLQRVDSSNNLFSTIAELAVGYDLGSVCGKKVSMPENYMNNNSNDNDKAAADVISYLEKELFIYAVDFNYNKRAPLEKFVLEAGVVVEKARLTTKSIRETWRTLVEELEVLEAGTRTRVMEDQIEGRDDALYTMKCFCAETVAHLRRDCKFDLQAASLVANTG